MARGQRQAAAQQRDPARPQEIEAEAIAEIARRERVSPAIVKATAMSVGHDRPKLVAAIRANKA